MKTCMTPTLRSAALCVTALAGALLLSACGKSTPPPAAAPTPVAPASAPRVQTPAVPAASSTLVPTSAAGVASSSPTMPAPAPLTIAKLTLGSAVNNEHQVTRASDSFASNDKAIYASVTTEGSTGGATLNAKWSYLEGQGQLVSSISQSIATDGPAITTFKVQNPDLWPAGKYQVEISLDGKPVTRQSFQIAKN